MAIILAIVVGLVCAALLFKFVRRGAVTIPVAGAVTTLIMFAILMPLALHDGWGGWAKEGPYMLWAALIYYVIGVACAGLVALARRADPDRRA